MMPDYKEIVLGHGAHNRAGNLRAGQCTALL